MSQTIHETDGSGRPAYTVDAEPNPYWNGRDFRLYRDGEPVAKIGMRDGAPVVDVRDRHLYDAAERELIDAVGEDAAQRIYDGCAETFWNIDAQAIAEGHGFERCYSAGRSSGWAQPDPTQSWPETVGLTERPAGVGEYAVVDDTDNTIVGVFDDLDAAEDYAENGYGDGASVDYEMMRAFDERERFYRFAEAITAAVEGAREMYLDELREAASEARRIAAAPEWIVEEVTTHRVKADDRDEALERHLADHSEVVEVAAREVYEVER